MGMSTFEILKALKEMGLPQTGEGFYLYDEGKAMEKINYHFGIYRPTFKELQEWIGLW